MKLSFAGPYKSICDLTSTTLPAFSVLTGANGSGKSQLLQAIASGRVLTDVAGSDHKRFIRLLDFQQIGQSSEADTHSPANAFKQAKEKWSAIGELKRTSASKVHSRIAQSSFKDIAGVFDPESLASATLEALATAFQALRGQDAPGSMKLANELKKTIETQISSILDNRSKALLSEPDVVAALGGSSVDKLLSTTEVAFLEAYPVLSTPSDAFAQKFSEMFAKYVGLYVTNDYERLKSQAGKAAGRWISDDDFFRRHGPFPWDLLNGLLAAARLPLEAVPPRLSVTDSYRFQMRHMRTGAVLNTGDLSSGERVLLSFALCMYHASTNDPQVSYPKVLLLDEIDASLHPSMVRIVLDAIINVLVAKQGINVVLTTHSPTTVALSPAESLHVVVEDGPERIRPIEKDKAISVLTSGLPALSIDYDNRRQVFVEGSSDAQAYESVFEVIRRRESCPISIAFIPVDPSRNAHGGCDRLRSIVSLLREAGNKKIYGIVDWDQGRTVEPDGVLKIEGRYSIENWLLDPVILAAALLKHECLNGGALDFPDGVTFRDLDQMLPDQWNAVIASMESRLGWSPGNRLQQRYAGAFELEIDDRWCNMRGHDLEELISDKVPQTRGIGRGGRPLFVRTATIAQEYPEFLPVELYIALQNIAS